MIKINFDCTEVIPNAVLPPNTMMVSMDIWRDICKQTAADTTIIEGEVVREAQKQLGERLIRYSCGHDHAGNPIPPQPDAPHVAAVCAACSRKRMLANG